jgi:hypothetical protein
LEKIAPVVVEIFGSYYDVTYWSVCHFCDFLAKINFPMGKKGLNGVEILYFPWLEAYEKSGRKNGALFLM